MWWIMVFTTSINRFPVTTWLDVLFYHPQGRIKLQMGQSSNIWWFSFHQLVQHLKSANRSSISRCLSSWDLIGWAWSSYEIHFWCDLTGWMILEIHLGFSAFFRLIENGLILWSGGRFDRRCMGTCQNNQECQTKGGKFMQVSNSFCSCWTPL